MLEDLKTRERKAYHADPLPTDREELMRLRTMVEMDMAQIKSQLENAATYRMETGEYADRRWYTSAKAALRFTGVHHQRVLQALALAGKAMKADNIKNSNTHEQFFVHALIKVLRRRFDESMAQELIDEAKEMATREEAKL